jgi:hypothetical protein
MKAAIYNVWADSHELLEFSTKSVRNFFDVIIAVVTEESNDRRKLDKSAIDECFRLSQMGLIDYIVIPKLPNSNAQQNEIYKRQVGILKAREIKAEWVLLMDSDECYFNNELNLAFDLIVKNDANGSFCRMYTYFKEPTLRLKTRETYSVPFLHRMKPDLKAGHRNYPATVDPTRKLNVDGRIMYLENIHMHHYSYIRRDMNMKVKYSTATRNIARRMHDLQLDLHNAKPGYKTRFYFDNELEEVPNWFGVRI